MKQRDKKLSGIISLIASDGYSMSFSLENLLEIILDMKADEWMTNGVDVDEYL